VVALQLLTLSCFSILAWFGTSYTIKAWEHTTSSLQIPMSIPFAVIPLSALVFIVHVLADMANTFEQREA
jgi:TRAP-type C4-dicarboxylate transport system permease small subunit